MINILLKYRRSLNAKEEWFEYDNLDRLTNANGINIVTKNVSYENNGNISTKDDVGIFTYDSDKLNAVVDLTNSESGNSSNKLDIPLFKQQVWYSSLDRPYKISEPKENLSGQVIGQQYKLYYGPNNDRAKVTEQISNNTNKRYYDGNYEKFIHQASNKTFEIHYLGFVNNIDAIIVIEEYNGTKTMKTYYSFTDYLGSIVKLIEENNSNSANPTFTDKLEFNFDAWGRLRNNTSLGDYMSSEEIETEINNEALFWFNRGFTGHEMLFNYSIINMNNRLYDPMVGRMFSVDNFISNANNLQSYNRYSYALNNPLKYSDPSGEIPVPVAMAIGAGVGIVSNGIYNVSNERNFFAGAFKAGLNGFVQGGISAGIGGAVAGAVGIKEGGKVGIKAALHALNSGSFSAANGGSFLSGAVSGSVSSLYFSSISGVAQDMIKNGNTFGAAALTIGGGTLFGGLSSSAAGGNFWDGARNGFITSALNGFAHLAFEQLMTNGGGLKVRNESSLFTPEERNWIINHSDSKLPNNPLSRARMLKSAYIQRYLERGAAVTNTMGAMATLSTFSLRGVRNYIPRSSVHIGSIGILANRFITPAHLAYSVLSTDFNNAQSLFNLKVSASLTIIGTRNPYGAMLGYIYTSWSADPELWGGDFSKPFNTGRNSMKQHHFFKNIDID